MHERNLLPDGYQIVADAVIQMVIGNPAKLEQVISWMNEVLEFYALPETNPDPAFIDHVAYSLLQIKAVETLPALKKNFDQWPVQGKEMIGGYESVSLLMGTEDYRLRAQFMSVDSYLRHYINDATWAEETFGPDGDEEEEDWEDENI